jgi:Flp pilus assembly protein TadG
LDYLNRNRSNKIATPSPKLRQREKGVEMLELAVVMPVLLIMLVGVLYFGRAWETKDVTDGAARDAARVAVYSFNDTTNPQCAGTPCSVQAAASAAVQSLTNASVDPCALTPSTTAPAVTGTFAWTYTSGACASSGLTYTLEVERAVLQTINGVDVISTRVTIIYPYAWNFVSVNPFGSKLTLTSQAIMANMN